jgi:hypothetical protein
MRSRDPEILTLFPASGSSPSPCHQLPQEEVWPHQPAPPQEEAEVIYSLSAGAQCSTEKDFGHGSCFWWIITAYSYDSKREMPTLPCLNECHQKNSSHLFYLEACFCWSKMFEDAEMRSAFGKWQEEEGRMSLSFFTDSARQHERSHTCTRQGIHILLLDAVLRAACRKYLSDTKTSVQSPAPELDKISASPRSPILCSSATKAPLCSIKTSKLSKPLLKLRGVNLR